MPEGFTATAFATGLEHPRRLLVLPNGDVLVAEQKVGYVTLLRDDDGDGKADWINRHIEGLNGPYGLAWRDGKVLVADQDGIWEVPHRVGAVRPGMGAGDTKAADVPPEQRKPTPSLVGEKMITKKGVFGIVMGHANRHLAIDPKTGGLFVGVGSSGNIGVEPEVKASIQRFDADGGNQTTFASGLRNATALAFHPDTGELYTVVQERDGLGDNLPPDYMTRVQQGGFYGWPYSYIGQHPQPGFAQLRPDKVKAAITPDVLFQPHSSAMDILFYTGSQFPAEYRGDAFVALKGSWNRSEPTGYKVVRVPFKDGKPQGSYQNFVTGFWVVRPAPRRSLGPAGRARRGKGWRAADRRRYRRHHLAHRLHRSKARRQRRAAADDRRSGAVRRCSVIPRRRQRRHSCIHEPLSPVVGTRFAMDARPESTAVAS